MTEQSAYGLDVYLQDRERAAEAWQRRTAYTGAALKYLAGGCWKVVKGAANGLYKVSMDTVDRYGAYKQKQRDDEESMRAFGLPRDNLVELLSRAKKKDIPFILYALGVRAPELRAQREQEEIAREVSLERKRRDRAASRKAFAKSVYNGIANSYKRIRGRRTAPTPSYDELIDSIAAHNQEIGMLKEQIRLVQEEARAQMERSAAYARSDPTKTQVPYTAPTSRKPDETQLLNRPDKTQILNTPQILVNTVIRRPDNVYNPNKTAAPSTVPEVLLPSKSTDDSDKSLEAIPEEELLEELIGINEGTEEELSQLPDELADHLRKRRK